MSIENYSSLKSVDPTYSPPPQTPSPLTPIFNSATTTTSTSTTNSSPPHPLTPYILEGYNIECKTDKVKFIHTHYMHITTSNGHLLQIDFSPLELPHSQTALIEESGNYIKVTINQKEYYFNQDTGLSSETEKIYKNYSEQSNFLDPIADDIKTTLVFKEGIVVIKNDSSVFHILWDQPRKRVYHDEKLNNKVSRNNPVTVHEEQEIKIVKPTMRTYEINGQKAFQPNVINLKTESSQETLSEFFRTAPFNSLKALINDKLFLLTGQTLCKFDNGSFKLNLEDYSITLKKEDGQILLHFNDQIIPVKDGLVKVSSEDSLEKFFSQIPIKRLYFNLGEEKHYITSANRAYYVSNTCCLVKVGNETVQIYTSNKSVYIKDNSKIIQEIDIHKEMLLGLFFEELDVNEVSFTVNGKFFEFTRETSCSQVSKSDATITEDGVKFYLRKDSTKLKIDYCHKDNSHEYKKLEHNPKILYTNTITTSVDVIADQPFVDKPESPSTPSSNLRPFVPHKELTIKLYGQTYTLKIEEPSHKKFQEMFESTKPVEEISTTTSGNLKSLFDILNCKLIKVKFFDQTITFTPETPIEFRFHDTWTINTQSTSFTLAIINGTLEVTCMIDVTLHARLPFTLA